MEYPPPNSSKSQDPDRLFGILGVGIRTFGQKLDPDPKSPKRSSGTFGVLMDFGVDPPTFLEFLDGYSKIHPGFDQVPQKLDQQPPNFLGVESNFSGFPQKLGSGSGISKHQVSGFHQKLTGLINFLGKPGNLVFSGFGPGIQELRLLAKS